MSDTKLSKLKDGSDMLRFAADLIEGARRATYGDRRENWKNVAALWSAYLGVKITPAQAVNLMVLLKMARTKTSDDPDNVIDMAGYSGLLWDLVGLET